MRSICELADAAGQLWQIASAHRPKTKMIAEIVYGD